MIYQIALPCKFLKCILFPFEFNEYNNFVSPDSCFLGVLYFHDHYKHPHVLDHFAADCVRGERSIMELIFWFIPWCCGNHFCREHERCICCI